MLENYEHQTKPTMKYRATHQRFSQIGAENIIKWKIDAHILRIFYCWQLKRTKSRTAHTFIANKRHATLKCRVTNKITHQGIYKYIHIIYSLCVRRMEPRGDEFLKFLRVRRRLRALITAPAPPLRARRPPAPDIRGRPKHRWPPFFKKGKLKVWAACEQSWSFQDGFLIHMFDSGVTWIISLLCSFKILTYYV